LTDASSPSVITRDYHELGADSLGDQGDGIINTEDGSVGIVPDASVGDEVAVKIDKARNTIRFATIVG
jgi:predicted RNA-binding protein with TRAM domain